MSRRISTKKRFPKKDSKYDNLLVSLLINRLLKNGKKRLATKICCNIEEENLSCAFLSC